MKFQDIVDTLGIPITLDDYIKDIEFEEFDGGYNYYNIENDVCIISSEYSTITYNPKSKEECVIFNISEKYLGFEVEHIYNQYGLNVSMT